MSGADLANLVKEAIINTTNLNKDKADIKDI